jgi:hypothetical protein
MALTKETFSVIKITRWIIQIVVMALITEKYIFYSRIDLLKSDEIVTEK